MRIVIDIDGTLNNMPDVLAMVAKEYCHEKGLPFPAYPNADSYDLCVRFGWDEKADRDFWATKAAKCFMIAQPLEHAVATVQRWFRNGHTIYIVTARNKRFETLTAEWLFKYRIPYDELHVGHNDKKALLDIIQPHLVIDDWHVDTGYPTLCMHQAFNNRPLPNGVVRIYSWNQANMELERSMRKC